MGSCSQNPALGREGHSPQPPAPAQILLPTRHPLPGPGCVPFPPPLTRQEQAERREHHEPQWSERGHTGLRYPGGRGRAELWEGWGQTSPLTFLLCDQAHQDPNGVLIGVISMVGRVDPWGRTENHDPREGGSGTPWAHRLHQDMAAEGAPGLAVCVPKGLSSDSEPIITFTTYSASLLPAPSSTRGLAISGPSELHRPCRCVG